MVRVEPQHERVLEGRVARPVLDDRRLLVFRRLDDVAQAEQPGREHRADRRTTEALDRRRFRGFLVVLEHGFYGTPAFGAAGPRRYRERVTNVRSDARSELLWQPSLLDVEAPSFDASFARARRIELDETAWVEHTPGWVSGAGGLFTQILDRAPWEQHRRYMYDRMVDEPRLTAWHGNGIDDPSLPAVVPEMAAALSARYDREFDAVGAACYRDGRDSVAWHADRIPAEIIEPVVAIMSLGSPRVLRLRCKAHHSDARAFTLLPGDLFVMGGMTQRTWEHSIPKVARAGPRLSLQFRHSA